MTFPYRRVRIKKSAKDREALADSDRTRLPL